MKDIAYLAAGKKMKTNSRVWWLFLFLVGLLAILSPRPTLAQEEKIDLTLGLASGRYYNEIVAGQDNILFMEIRNSGNKTLTNIRLSSVKPEGWTIDFKPGDIANLSPGNFQTVDVNIKPAVKTAEDNYEVVLVAESNEIRKVLSIEVRVKAPQGTWLWIGGIILLVVVTGFTIVFMRLGKGS